MENSEHFLEADKVKVTVLPTDKPTIRYTKDEIDLALKVHRFLQAAIEDRMTQN
jgi:hypothetical protein